jgi:hypothetical protein
MSPKPLSPIPDILSPLSVSKELSEKSSGTLPYNFSVENADRDYLRDPSHPDYKELNPLDIKSRTEVGNKQEHENAIVKDQEGRLDLEEMKPGIVKRTIKNFLDSKSEKALENREYAMEQIHARRNDNDIISDPIISKAEETNVAASSLLDQLRDYGNNKINDIFKKAEINEPLKTNDSNITIPDFHDSKDSNDSMEHYFPKAKVFDNQITDKTKDLSVLKPYVKAPKDSDLMNAIEESKSDGVKEEREGLSDMINAKDVLSTPNVGNVGLQTPIADRINPSPIANKPSLSNLFDNFNEVYDDTGIDIEDSNGNSNENKDESSNTQEDNNPIKQNVFSNLLQQINSHRKEYGTPLNSNKDLSSESENSDESEESSSERSGPPEEEISPIN